MVEQNNPYHNLTLFNHTIQSIKNIEAEIHLRLTMLLHDIGKPKVTMFLTLSRQVIFLIPLIIILGKTFGGIGVWIAAPIADSLSFLVTLIMVKREIKNLDYLKHKENILE